MSTLSRPRRRTGTYMTATRRSRRSLRADAAPPALWAGPIGVEGEKTGDGRVIAPGALRWDTLPVPLRYVSQDVGAHDGAQVVGHVLNIERRPDGIIWGSAAIPGIVKSCLLSTNFRAVSAMIC